jgi:hypothetical protein
MATQVSVLPIASKQRQLVSQLPDQIWIHLLHSLPPANSPSEQVACLEFVMAALTDRLTAERERLVPPILPKEYFATLAEDSTQQFAELLCEGLHELESFTEQIAFLDLTLIHVTDWIATARHTLVEKAASGEKAVDGSPATSH